MEEITDCLRPNQAGRVISAYVLITSRAENESSKVHQYHTSIHPCTCMHACSLRTLVIATRLHLKVFEVQI